MIDPAMGYELVDDWLPDFIAYAENPTHTNAEALLKQARDRVQASYAGVSEHDELSLTELDMMDYACDDVLVILEAVAEWFVENRTSPDSGSDQ